MHAGGTNSISILIYQVVYLWQQHLAHLSAQLWNSKHNFFGFCWILNPQEQGMTFQKSNKCYNFLLTHKPHMSSKENKPKYFFFKTKKKYFYFKIQKNIFLQTKIFLQNWCTDVGCPWLEWPMIIPSISSQSVLTCSSLLIASDPQHHTLALPSSILDHSMV